MLHIDPDDLREAAENLEVLKAWNRRQPDRDRGPGHHPWWAMEWPFSPFTSLPVASRPHPSHPGTLSTCWPPSAGALVGPGVAGIHRRPAERPGTGTLLALSGRDDRRPAAGLFFDLPRKHYSGPLGEVLGNRPPGRPGQRPHRSPALMGKSMAWVPLHRGLRQQPPGGRPAPGGLKLLERRVCELKETLGEISILASSPNTQRLFRINSMLDVRCSMFDVRLLLK